MNIPGKTTLIRILRWSERYTKTDMVYLVSGSFWLTLSQFFSVASSFVLSILFARYLSKDTFGIYKYVLSIAGFFSTFSLNGMNMVIIRATSQGRDGTFKKSLGIQLKWTIGYFLLSSVVSGYYFSQGNSSYAICFVLVAILGPLSTVANSFSSFLQGKQDFKTSSLYSIYSSVIQFVVLAATIVYLPKYVFLVGAYYIATTASNVYFCAKVLRRFPTSSNTLSSVDMAYAKRLSFMTILGGAANQIDSIMVYHLLGPAQLAIYTFSILIPERVRSVMSIIVSAALPRLSEHGGGTKESLLRKSLQLFILGGFLVIVYTLVAPALYGVLFPQYLESVSYSQWYSLSFLALPSFIALPSLYAKQDEGALYVINVILPACKIFTSLVAVFFWGILGAIGAKLIHYVLQVALSYYYAVMRGRVLERN